MRDIRWPEEMKIPHEKCSCTACWYACGINRGIMESKRAWQEAQAGEYIKQAVDNGYSLKSDKPPLSALDESEVNDWFAEHFSDTDKKYYDTDLAKKFCEQFGTPPVKKVSVKELQKVVEEYYRKQHEVGDTIKMKSIHTFDIAQSIVDYLEGKGGR